MTNYLTVLEDEIDDSLLDIMDPLSFMKDRKHG